MSDRYLPQMRAKSNPPDSSSIQEISCLTLTRTSKKRRTCIQRSKTSRWSSNSRIFSQWLPRQIASNASRRIKNNKETPGKATFTRSRNVIWSKSLTQKPSLSGWKEWAITMKSVIGSSAKSSYESKMWHVCKRIKRRISKFTKSLSENMITWSIRSVAKSKKAPSSIRYLKRKSRMRRAKFRT